MLHRVAAQIKIAVLKTKIFVCNYESSILLANLFDRERKLLRSCENLNISCFNFNFTGCHIGINIFISTGINHAFNCDTIFTLEAGSNFLYIITSLIANHYLSNSIAVAKTNKQKTTQVTGAAYPTIQNNFFTNITLAKLAASYSSLRILHNFTLSGDDQ